MTEQLAPVERTDIPPVTEESHDSPISVAPVLQWFTAEIDELRAQVKALTRERDRLAAQLSPSPVQRTKVSVGGTSIDKVNEIIDALVRWNNAQPDPLQQVRISVPVIKSLGILIGATYQPAIQEALQARASEIDEVHKRFLIGSRHNRNIDKDAVLQAIARDCMGVSHWQDVRFK